MQEIFCHLTILQDENVKLHNEYIESRLSLQAKFVKGD
jgi:hypothetical protein